MFGEGIIWCGLFQLALIKIPITLSLIGVTSSSEIQFLAFKLIKILLNFLLRLSCFFSISLVSFNFRARGLVATFISISQTHFDSASVLFSTTLHLLTKRQKPKLFFFSTFCLGLIFSSALNFYFFFFCEQSSSVWLFLFCAARRQESRTRIDWICCVRAAISASGET